MSSLIPVDVQEAYQHRGSVIKIIPLDAGLINQTFLVLFASGPVVIQKIAPIFGPGVHEDFKAVTNYLHKKGVISPLIIENDAGLLTTLSQGETWRAQTYIAGHSVHTISSPHRAFQAGKILGEFHFALKDFAYTYKNHRRHGGDYAFHQENLVKALTTHPEHDFFDNASTLASQLMTSMKELGPITTTLRHAHGDPKISNILFDEKEQALCLVDMDTLSFTGWSLELGDAMRSWTNKSKEDVEDCHADMDIFAMALKGYASVMRGILSEIEIGQFLKHVKAITLCLSMRYLADTLNESYFSFDKNRFSRSAAHNLVRAKAMFNLFHSFKDNDARMSTIAKDLLLSKSLF